MEQGHRVNWVSGSLDSRVTGSLGHKMWPSSISADRVVVDGSRREAADDGDGWPCERSLQTKSKCVVRGSVQGSSSLRVYVN